MSEYRDNLVKSYFLIEILLYGAVMIGIPRIITFGTRLILLAVVTSESVNFLRKCYKIKLHARLVWWYILYLFITALFSLFESYPAGIYIEAINQGVIPILFFFIAYKYKDVRFEEDPLLRRYLYACLFMYACSLYLFFTMPSWYIEWKKSILPEEWQNNLAILSVLSGFSGTGYLVGYTSFFAFSFLVIRYIYGSGTRYDFLYLCITSLCMLLSQTRASLFMSLALLTWVILSKLTGRKRFYAIIAVIMILSSIIYLLNNNEAVSEVSNIFASKLEGTSSSSRYDTGIKLLSYQTNYLFGHGYGTGGNVANGLGYPSVTDCEYFKLFYETGLVGITFFFTIIINFYRKVLRCKKRYMFELFIVSFYLLAMNIADPLSVAPMMSPVFWYSIGRVNLCHSNFVKLSKR